MAQEHAHSSGISWRACSAGMASIHRLLLSRSHMLLKSVNIPMFFSIPDTSISFPWEKLQGLYLIQLSATAWVELFSMMYIIYFLNISFLQIEGCILRSGEVKSFDSVAAVMG